MKILNIILLFFLLLPFSSCNLGLDQELDKKAAEDLILENKSHFTQDDLNKCNAQEIIISNGDYLFVENSFNGDFNGYVYSKKEQPNFEEMKFDDFYIIRFDSSDGLWTKVYGGW